MKLIEMTGRQFLDVLRSDAPAPGGGSVSAYAGAKGVALFMMVSDLTIGKPKYADFEDTCKEAVKKGEAIWQKLADNIDRDTDAYFLMANAFKMPKETDEQKAARSAKIAEGTLVATEIPFEVMTLGLEGLKAAHSILGKSNPNAASDLGVAAQCLATCVKGAWLNVKINVGGVKDAARKEQFEKDGEKMYREAIKLSDEIYEGVLRAL